MVTLWRKLVQEFDAGTAALEAKAAELELQTRQLGRETEQIRQDAEQVRRKTALILAETEEMRLETERDFNEAVSQLGIEIENTTSPEKRELLRSLALHLYQAVSPT